MYFTMCNVDVAPPIQCFHPFPLVLFAVLRVGDSFLPVAQSLGQVGRGYLHHRKSELPKDSQR
jgi:hypothetical protein